MANSGKGKRETVTHLGASVAGARNGAAPPHRYSEELLKNTAEYWRGRGGRELSGEDARQILENLTGFFGTLMEWDARSAEGGGGTPGTKSPIESPMMEGEAGTRPLS